MNGVEKIHNIARPSDSASPARRSRRKAIRSIAVRPSAKARPNGITSRARIFSTRIGIAHQSQTNGSQPLSLTCTLSNRQSDAELFGGDFGASMRNTGPSALSWRRDFHVRRTTPRAVPIPIPPGRRSAESCV